VRDATTPPGASGCLRGIALGDSVDPAELDVVVRVSGEASAERFQDPGIVLGDAFEPGEAEAKGDIARLPLTYRPRPGVTPIQAFVARFVEPYRCPGG
jgi:hypothetical protein